MPGDDASQAEREKGLGMPARLLDNVGESLAAVDREGRITYWNRAAEALYGWRAHEVMGRSAIDFLPHPDGGDELSAARQKLEKGESFSGEYRMKRKDGSLIYVDVRTDPILEGGDLVGFVSIGRDLTQKREVEKHLRFQARLLDSVGQAVIATDLDGKITYWNEAATQIYGWTADEVIGRSVLEVTPTDQSREEARRIFDRMRRGEAWHGEFHVRRKHGSPIVVDVQNTPIMDDAGGLVGIIGVSNDITERREAEKRLAFQANLLDEVRQAVFATSLEGEILYWNPGAETLYGWPSSDVVGRKIQDVLGSEFTEEPGEAGSSDHWVARQDGAKVLVSLSSSPLYTKDRDLAGFIGVAADVTKERVMQRRYQEMVDFSPDGILRTTPEGAIQYANPAAASILGYDDREQLLEEVDRVTDLYVDAADRKRLLAELEKDHPGPIEARLRRRDGRFVWVEIRAGVHREPDGGAVIEGSFHDLSNRREREELSQRLAAIIEASNEAIFSKDLDGVVQTWNTGAERLYGYSADEALGRNIEDLIVPEDEKAEFRTFMKRLRAGRIVGRLDTVRRRKDGAFVDVSLTMTPLRDASGKLVAASVSAHDISDRKRAEEAEIARLENEHLKKIDQTLRDFMNAAAHDLNQPLTPMKISLAMLQRFTGDLPDKAKRMLEMLDRNVGRMELLVQDMLDVARLESGTLRFDMEDTRLSDLAHETLEFFEVQAADDGIELRVKEGQDVYVRADGRRVIQVLFNIVGNALKFTPEGGNITITTAVEGDFAKVSVQDTGPGLTEEQMGKLFKAFQQVHDAGGPKGTGLGLYISKAIVEHHGSKIGVESGGPGQGSTFWFTLPVAGSQDTAEEE